MIKSEKIKGLVLKSKNAIAGAVGTVVVGATTAAMAVGVENTAVTGAFTQLKEDVLATMSPIATAAVGVAVLLFAWRYGRKIFTTIAK